MTTDKRQFTKGYAVVVTDSKGYRYYPIEGADGIGKTTIERADSSALHRGYQIHYPTREAAERAIPIVRILATAKGENATTPDRPILPIEIGIEPRKK